MKRIFNILLFMLVVLSLFPASEIHANSSWIPPKYVEVALAAKEVIVGDPDGQKRWSDIVTRAEAAKILVMATRIQAGTTRILSSRFSDVPDNHWANEFITLAAEAEIIQTFDNKTFHPEEYVTMGEYVIMLGRIWQRLRSGVIVHSSNSLIDPELFSMPFLSKYLALDHEGTISLDFQITRAQAGQLIYEFMEEYGLLIDIEGITSDVNGIGRTIWLDFVGHWREIQLSSEVVVFKADGQVSIDAMQKGNQVSLILDKDGRVIWILISSLEGMP